MPDVSSRCVARAVAGCEARKISSWIGRKHIEKPPWNRVKKTWCPEDPEDCPNKFNKTNPLKRWMKPIQLNQGCIYIYPTGSMYAIYANMNGVYWWDPCYHIYQHHGSYGYIYREWTIVYQGPNGDDFNGFKGQSSPETIDFPIQIMGLSCKFYRKNPIHWDYCSTQVGLKQTSCSLAKTETIWHTHLQKPTHNFEAAEGWIVRGSSKLSTSPWWFEGVGWWLWFSRPRSLL